MIRIDEIKLPINYSDVDLYNAVAKRLKSKVGQFKNVKLVRKSMDARKKEQIHFVVGVTLDFVGNEDKKIKQLKDKKITKAVNFSYKMPMVDYGGRYRPVVVGAGPCGIFAALVLAEAGLKPLVIEGGKDVSERKKDVENFWQKGLFSPSSNV
ncbi:MAG: FAD-dependent monooxygenase, partial [Clostridiales bacterium]